MVTCVSRRSRRRPPDLKLQRLAKAIISNTIGGSGLLVGSLARSVPGNASCAHLARQAGYEWWQPPWS